MSFVFDIHHIFTREMIGLYGDDITQLFQQGEFTEIRHRVATQPMLNDLLIKMEVNGRDYLERAEQEDEQPLLLLPAAPA